MKLCVAQTYAETYDPPQPAEFCDEESVPFSDYCGHHLYLDSSLVRDDDYDPTDDNWWPFQ